MKKIDEDIKYVASIAEMLGFANKSFLVTGATGMIGRNLVNVLKCITSEDKIYVLGLNQDEVNSVYLNSKLKKISFASLDSIDESVDYVFHLASPTNSIWLKEKPVETIDFIYSSTKTILDFARQHSSSVLYVSSMEVYGEIFDKKKKNEKELGYLDLTNTRNSYPEAKRMCELLCYSFFCEFSLDVKCVRLAQTFGAGTNYNDQRVFGYFARCAVNKENIVLGTKGDSFGNYCYLFDTLSSFFYALSKGNPGETYNVVGDNCRYTIFDLASFVVNNIAHHDIQITFNISNSQYPAPTMLNMDNSKLKGIGWRPKYSIEDMFTRMIDNWRDEGII